MSFDCGLVGFVTDRRRYAVQGKQLIRSNFCRSAQYTHRCRASCTNRVASRQCLVSTTGCVRHKNSGVNGLRLSIALFLACSARGP
jgi:hypothetical protein